MLQETLTDGERVLVANGHMDKVVALRSGYQQVLREEAVALIEAVLGRTVIGFMSNNHFDPDLAAELFVLDPSEDSDADVPQEAEHGEREQEDRHAIAVAESDRLQSARPADGGEAGV